MKNAEVRQIKCIVPSVQVQATIHKDGVTTSRMLSLEEVRNLTGEDFNLVLDLVHVDIRVKPPGQQPFEVPPGLVEIGGQPLSVLVKLLRRPGMFLTPYDIGQMEPRNDSHFITDNITQYVMKLRKRLFRENATAAQFILTIRQPYRVAFNRKLSFCLAEPASEQKDNSGIQ